MAVEQPEIDAHVVPEHDPGHRRGQSVPAGEVDDLVVDARRLEKFARQRCAASVARMIQVNGYLTEELLMAPDLQKQAMRIAGR